ncbi:hypothetical protein D0Z00_000219 [Geotrichum galactomycetum]|uniref:Uncharacterized protein n=1 Tax=Geotrichum galactomycetum TaxID=27317 RepID=A0ACB6VAA1_9ASCO|nr:hypothetical protein D0Z00_000219 [Geotrichum candidum]
MSLVSGSVEVLKTSAKDFLISTTGGGSKYVLEPGEELIDLNSPIAEVTVANESSLKRQLNASKLGGLYNEGNTCFMNSIIQAVASLDSVDDFLKNTFNTPQILEANDKKPIPTVLFKNLIHQLNQKSLASHTYSTNDLIKSIGTEANKWLSYDQQDAQEYFQQVLSFIEADFKKLHQENNTKVPRIVTPFDGETAIRVGCLKCGEMEGIRKEVSSSVGLSLSANVDHFTLLDLLKEYTHLETISGVECYRCSLVALEQIIKDKLDANDKPMPEPLRKPFEKRLDEIRQTLQHDVIDETKYKALKPQKVKELIDKSKQIMFAKPPPKVLAIHLNRSVFDLSTGYIRKNLSPVDYDEYLDLTPFVVADIDDPANKDPKHSMRAAAEGTEMDDRLRYRLKSVVIHYGSHNFGHYICFRRDSRHGIWWRISDHNVIQVDIDQVLNAQGVFMVFYEQVSVTAPHFELSSLNESSKEETRAQVTSDNNIVIDSASKSVSNTLVAETDEEMTANEDEHEAAASVSTASSDATAVNIPELDPTVTTSPLDSDTTTTTITTASITSTSTSKSKGAKKRKNKKRK